MATKQNLSNEEKTEKKTTSAKKTSTKKTTSDGVASKKVEKKTTTKAASKKVESKMLAKEKKNVEVKTISKKTNSTKKDPATKSDKKTTTTKKITTTKKTVTKKPEVADSEKKVVNKTPEKKTTKKTAVKSTEKRTSTKKSTELSPTGVMIKNTVAPLKIEDTRFSSVSEKSKTKLEEIENKIVEKPIITSVDNVSKIPEIEKTKTDEIITERKFFSNENTSFTEVVKPESNFDKSNEDYRTLDQMMQNSGLRKNSDFGIHSEEKKEKKKYLLLLLLLLALLGVGIGIGVKVISDSRTAAMYSNPEDAIAYCEKLIAQGIYAEPFDILSGLKIDGNDEESLNLRRKIIELIKTGYEKALAENKEDEILKKINDLESAGKNSGAIKLIVLGTDLNGDDLKTKEFKNKLLDLEKSFVDKVVANGNTQDVLDVAKDLIDSDEEILATKLLSLLDIEGNSTEARMMRNQVYSLKKDAIGKTIKNGKANELFDVINSMNENGNSVEAQELLSYVEIIGDDDEQNALRDKLSKLKKETTDKVFLDGKQEELINKAKQMISDGDYSSALGLLSSVKPEGDDTESRAFRNSLKSLKKGTVDRAFAEGRIDDVFSTVDTLNNNGDNASALELLSMINVIGDSEEAKAIRKEIDAKKQETLNKAIKNGKIDEVLKEAKQMIDDGDYSGALDFLSSAALLDNSPELKEIKKEIEKLEKSAVTKAIEDGRGDEILDTVERLLKEENYNAVDSILSQIDKIEKTTPESAAFINRAERLKKQNDILSLNENLSDAEKIQLAEKLIKDGRYDEALTLLNSIKIEGNDEDSAKLKEKISNLKKDAVSKAKKNGVDLGVLGYDENGNPVLSKEEVARRQQQERIAKEAAEKKAEEEKLIAQIKKEQEEKLRKEEIAKEKKAKLEAEKKARLEAEKKAAEEKRLKEEAIKKAAEEKRLKEEASKNADIQLKKGIEDSIANGKKMLSNDDIDGAAKTFFDVESKLPSNDPKYSAEKLEEMAKSLYDASEKKDGADKKKLETLAGKMARDALNLSSSNPDTLYIAGIDALNKKNFLEAEKLLNEAIIKNPANFMYYFQLGRILAMQKKYSESLNAFQNCTKINEKYAPAYYNSGYVSEQMKKNNDALAFYKKSTEINPNYENAYIGQSHIFFDMEKYDDAINSLTKAMNINPNRAQIYQELGSCSVGKKDFVQAENYFKKALQCADSTKEKNALTYYNLSTVMSDQNKKDEALDYAVKAYDSRERTENSVKVNIVYNYALLMQDVGNESEAINLYKEVLMLDSKHVKSNTNLGAIYLKQNKDSDAILVLTNAYNIENDNFEVNNNLGSAYRKLLNYQKSAEHYKNALKVNPNDLTVKQNLARSYAASKDYSNAKKLYEELISKEPNNNDHLFELANLAYEKEDKDTAAKCLVKLKMVSPNYKTEQVEAMLKDLGY